MDFRGTPGRRLAAAALVVACATLPGPAAAQSKRVETAALPPATESFGLAEVQPPLSGEDVKLYKQVFSLQDSGRWKEADALIARLEDRTLLGHVLAQRYLHPTKYRSRYAELAAWLDLYADHPDARRIYQFALKRKPARAKAPRQPAAPQVDLLTADSPDETFVSFGEDGSEAGESARARADAQPPRSRARKISPGAHWTTGLNAYRDGRFRDAAGHFEAVAVSPRLSEWSIAAAAFWAARANMVGRRPERVNQWLEIAAEHPRTFYGIIARRVLGMESALTWDHPRLNASHLAAVLQSGPARRAMALVQVGQSWRAERELRQIAAADDPDMRLALIALADEVRLPALALSASKSLVAAGGTTLDRGLYPIPGWTPKNGFTVDRALIYAFMRQESAFNVAATSRAGARGLMQLMPATASFMGKARLAGKAQTSIYDPELNIELGQRYLRYLIDHEQVQGDLFLLAAAYNGGPGNLAKWQKRAGRSAQDPLLFIETIPARETRLFIEQVLANLWIYRERLGQVDPSLDAIAAGERPVYKALDPETVASAGNGGN